MSHNNFPDYLTDTAPVRATLAMRAQVQKSAEHFPSDHPLAKEFLDDYTPTLSLTEALDNGN